ncbi:MAG: AMP-binding protein [Marinobacterium sp.]|nr:AMP-binding protein [Marinobacterium sp.]
MEYQRGVSIPGTLNSQHYGSLVSLLSDLCHRYADRPAFSSFGRTLSYGELEHLSAAFASYIQQQTDLRPGDRIAIQMPNMIQYPVVLFGALRAGLVVVNTNPLYTSAEMRHQFSDAGVRALVIHKSMAHKLEPILDDVDISYTFITQIGDLHGMLKRTLLNGAIRYIKRMEPPYHLPGAIALRDALSQGDRSQLNEHQPRPEELAVLQYTGGTTGVAKGAMLSHANLLSNLLQVSQRLQSAPANWQTDVVAPLPLYHIYAFIISLVVMEAGGHSLLITNPRDLGSVVTAMEGREITAFIGLNTLFTALCNHSGFQQLDFSRLRLTVSGGMALTHSAAHRWQQVTGCPVMEGYGLTEASPVVAFNPPDAVRLGTIGLPVAETEIRLIDSAGQSVVSGEYGELCVRGPQVMQGYWQQAQATAEVFTDDGFLKTGDMARQCSEGYLSIVDRIKDIIIVSGFNVYPNELEDLISTHPDVLECAVVGVADESSGERVRLFVVPADPARFDRGVLLSWCRQQLAGYKVPREICCLETLPKTPVGKVLRRELRMPVQAAEMPAGESVQNPHERRAV